MNEYRERLNQIASLVIARVRSPWIAAPLILFALVYAFLVYGYMGEIPKQDDLTAQAERLAQIAASGATLERLEIAEAELMALQDSVPSGSLREIDVFETMWALAEEVGLDRANVDISLKGEKAKAKVGSAEFRTLAFTLEAAGDADSMWSLIQRLDKGETPFKTLVLGDTSLTFGGTTTASLDFTIYAKSTGQ